MMESADYTFKENLDLLKENRAKYVHNEDILNVLNDAEKMQISGATDDENQIAENLRVFAELDSQIAAACDKYIDMLVPTEDDPNRSDDIVLPIPRMISNDEYSAIISTMNLKQREFLLHVLHYFKEEKLL
ncbi:hypothetical protein AVEN_219191-1 [Araneus ventricosus]|uniref:Uncharacterized protein n=1 Tax=Araneus ventricosus TaxID=182803 RepID=A0A4Y2HW91_ARAVE|nr:hypothetical protein AVEN_219191-1 [Araneus ventricosus]